MLLTGNQWQLGLLLGVLIGTCSQALAQTQPAAPAKASHEEPAKPQSLFDGKTLANWKVTDFGGQGRVTTEDGVMELDFGSDMTGVTWTGPALPQTNFEITLDAQRVDGGDFFCGLTFPVKQSHCSLILGGWGGGVTGLSSLDGLDASSNDTTSFLTYESKKWYKVRLRVTDVRIVAWLDDKVIIDTEIKDKKVGTRIEVDLSKPLGLSCYATRAAYKNITLRELMPKEVALHNSGK